MINCFSFHFLNSVLPFLSALCFILLPKYFDMEQANKNIFFLFVMALKKKSKLTA